MCDQNYRLHHCDQNYRLRHWLIEQIDSGMHPGLIWEDDEKTMFRLPWKHVYRHNYNLEVDASIYKAWAVFKGKFKEGDKASKWKTRLRCLLNKSPDFEEVTDRSQLDIFEPYKVYRIVPEEERKNKLGLPLITAFFQMVISFYYGGQLMSQTITTCPGGCLLSLSKPDQPRRYGSDDLEPVCFPPADTLPCERQRQATRKLFTYLERGVILHSDRRGVFVTRLCQCRVFYSGNMVRCKERPNKLKRERIAQVYDTDQFIQELQQFCATQSRLPSSRVILCFGEEFPDTAPLHSKLILVQVEQLYVWQLIEETSKNYGVYALMPALEEPGN